eukprot:INCI16240.1.p1 GENE.INCI16240.1~~INCI16240.1.p1  ORF type:complete len:214 (+),score=27.27 INCI16240.1:349-990(+)
MHSFRNEVQNHVTTKMQNQRLQYLTVQHDRHKPAHERLSDPRYATGIYRKRFEDFGPNHDFRRAMERRVESRQREMKNQFPLMLRKNAEDQPRHARRPPKQYDSSLREQFNANTSGAHSFLRQASHYDDEQELSPMSSNGGVGRRRGSVKLPGIGKANSRDRSKKKKLKPLQSHRIHGQFEIAKPKDYKEKQRRLLATLSRFKKGPKGDINVA